MRRDKIVVLLIVIIILIFAVRACGLVRHKDSGTENVNNIEDTVLKEKMREPDMAEVVDDAKTMEDGEVAEENTADGGVMNGLEISGYTAELERILEVDADTVTKEWRNWLDRNGYSGIGGVAICDTVKVTLSEQRFTVECQLVSGGQGQGNGVQSETLIMGVMDYYKNRGLFQFRVVN